MTATRLVKHKRKSFKTEIAVAVPVDLRKALNKNKAAKVLFEKFPPSHKRAYIEYIEEAKRPETRAARIEKGVAKLAENEK